MTDDSINILVQKPIEKCDKGIKGYHNEFFRDNIVGKILLGMRWN